MKLVSRPIIVGGMIGLTLLVRSRSFDSPIDGNAGLYAHVAYDWLHGSLPYVNTWEYKPPGLFALFALALAVISSPSIAIAALATLAVAATGILLLLLLDRCGFGTRAGVLAGVFYILLTGEDAGILDDAELYIAPFACAALLALAPFRPDRKPLRLWRYAVAGLAAGCALQMMLTALSVVALLALVIGLKAGRRALVPMAVVLLAVCAPFALEAVVYSRAGHLTDFFDANVGATLRRLASRLARPPPADKIYVAEQLRLLGPAIELAVLVPFVARSRDVLVLWTWLALEIAMVVLAGEYYAAHLLQVIAPLSALGAIAVDRLCTMTGRPRLIFAIFALGTFAMHGYFHAREFAKFAYHRVVLRDSGYEREHFDIVRNELRRRLASDRSLYIIDESAELYDEFGVRSPTRYPFTADLLEPSLEPMLGFDGIDEIERVLRTQPHYLLVGRRSRREVAASLHVMSDLIARQYRVILRVGRTTLYALRMRRGYASSKRPNGGFMHRSS